MPSIASPPHRQPARSFKVTNTDVNTFRRRRRRRLEHLPSPFDPMHNTLGKGKEGIGNGFGVDLSPLNSSVRWEAT
eukprot:6470831-Amphidinium_carterae.1